MPGSIANRPHERVHRIAADRDHYHAEMMRLRIEVARQSAEIDKLRAEVAAARASKPGSGKR